MKKLDETYFDNAINELCKLMDDEPCFVKELIYEFAKQIARDGAEAQKVVCRKGILLSIKVRTQTKKGRITWLIELNNILEAIQSATVEFPHE